MQRCAMATTTTAWKQQGDVVAGAAPLMEAKQQHTSVVLEKDEAATKAMLDKAMSEVSVPVPSSSTQGDAKPQELKLANKDKKAAIGSSSGSSASYYSEDSASKPLAAAPPAPSASAACGCVEDRAASERLPKTPTACAQAAFLERRSAAPPDRSSLLYVGIRGTMSADRPLGLWSPTLPGRSAAAALRRRPPSPPGRRRPPAGPLGLCAPGPSARPATMRTIRIPRVDYAEQRLSPASCEA